MRFRSQPGGLPAMSSLCRIRSAVSARVESPPDPDEPLAQGGDHPLGERPFELLLEHVGRLVERPDGRQRAGDSALLGGDHPDQGQHQDKTGEDKDAADQQQQRG